MVVRERIALHSGRLGLRIPLYHLYRPMSKSGTPTTQNGVVHPYYRRPTQYLYRLPNILGIPEYLYRLPNILSIQAYLEA